MTMTMTFWGIASALMAAALWFVIPPLRAPRRADEGSRRAHNLALFRDKLAELDTDRARGTLSDEQYAQSRADLEHHLLQDLLVDEGAAAAPASWRRPRWFVAVLVIALPVAAVGFYLGRVTAGSTLERALATTPGPATPTGPAMAPPGMPPGGLPAHPQGKTSLSLDEAVARLSKRLAEHPDDPDGWQLLGESYRYLGKEEQAQAAFARATSLRGTGATPSGPAGAPTSTVGAPPATAATDLGALEQRLAKTPDDAPGWAQLGRLYQGQKRYADASQAYAKALAIDGTNADWLADAADATAAGRHSLDGPAQQLIDRALAADPNHVKALWLAASAARQRGDHAAALDLWLRLQKQLPPDSPDTRIIAANIDETRAALDSAGGSGPDAETRAPPAGAGAIRGTVTLDSGLAGAVSGDETLFVFARAVDGPPMPLAVLRKRVSDLPLEFTLDDSQAVMPTAKLSSVREVIVGARISRSGNAMPQPGDLEGRSDTVRVGEDTPVRIVIDRRT